MMVGAKLGIQVRHMCVILFLLHRHVQQESSLLTMVQWDISTGVMIETGGQGHPFPIHQLEDQDVVHPNMDFLLIISEVQIGRKVGVASLVVHPCRGAV